MSEFLIGDGWHKGYLNQVMICARLVRRSFLVPCLRILPCCLIFLTLSGCETLADWDKKREAQRKIEREAERADKMAAYEAQRDDFVECSPELKEVLCSETPRDRRKIRTSLLVLRGAYWEFQQGLENIVPMEDEMPCCFRFASKYMYVTAASESYRFRLYKLIPSWGTNSRMVDQGLDPNSILNRVNWEIPLWDLEIKFPESTQADGSVRLEQVISIMVPRFQKVIR